ncbi:MAG: ECF-type sigma factor [Imperialibacter sp.]|uniref:ECF-type sigma factor n=1 Tax=Imperialibacter sp. TaxID=2038411 RepID=UPI0032F05293
MSEAELEKLIDRINRGDQKALDELFPVVYDELRKNAHHLRFKFRQQETLNTTALVHEAYLKLSKADLSKLQSKEHFYNLAAKAIRQILVNACLKKQTDKRGNQPSHLKIDDLEEHINFTEETGTAILKIHEALEVLEKREPTYGKIVECRFFAGLSIDETAKILGTSPSTVKRSWSMAKTWLHMQLSPSAA